MRDECEHGSLRRSCEICERDAEIARLRTAMLTAAAQLVRLFDVPCDANRPVVYRESVVDIAMRLKEERGTR